MHDRRVHAHALDGSLQVVRYERAGKWYLEQRVGPRQQVAFVQAVHAARRIHDDGGVVVHGIPGGTAFDRAVFPLPPRKKKR